jgi:hypothetical protein
MSNTVQFLNYLRQLDGLYNVDDCQVAMSCDKASFIVRDEAEVHVSAKNYESMIDALIFTDEFENIGFEYIKKFALSLQFMKNRELDFYYPLFKTLMFDCYSISLKKQVIQEFFTAIEEVQSKRKNIQIIERQFEKRVKVLINENARAVQKEVSA